MADIISNRKVRSTVSKAFEMSIKMMAPLRLWATITWGRKVVRAMVSLMCRPGRKADCSGPMEALIASAKRWAKTLAKRR